MSRTRGAAVITELSALNWLYRFLRAGPFAALRLARDVRLMHASGLFDRDWYLSTYPEVPADRALVHFLEMGWLAGHNPGPNFDTSFYLASNPDVARAGINPAVHFVLHGRTQGRLPRQEPDALSIETGLICASGLFDPDWYLSTYPEVPADRALAHFLEAGWLAGHNPGPSFDTSFYLASNPDIARAGINPVVHFILHGRAEGRLPRLALLREAEPNPLSFEQIRPVLAQFQLDPAAATQAIKRNFDQDGWPRLIPGAPVAVFVHSAGNLFMREIAELIVAGLAAAGFAADLRDEDSALSADREGGALVPGAARIVVAPHEFFLLPSRDGRVLPAEWANGAVLVNVEQLHTSWFQAGAPALQAAAAILDIDLQSAAVFAKAGLRAAHLPLGYVAGFNPFALQHKLPDVPALLTLERSIKKSCPIPDAPLSERPIDIFFIGYLSQRRSGILERMAQRLARWRCHFVLTDADRPQTSGGNAVLETEASVGIAQRAKIVLNLHQSDEPFFEWHRIVLQGIWQRALVISEPVAMQAHFTAGEHFLEAPLDELADLIDWVLGTEAGMRTAERIRVQAYEQLTQRVRISDSLRELFLERRKAPRHERTESGGGAAATA